MQAKKTYSRLGWCYIAGTVVINVIQLLYAWYIKKYQPALMENMNITLIMSSITVYVFGLPLIYLLARRMPTTQPEKHKMKWWQFIFSFLMCYAMVYVSNIIGTILTTIIGNVKGSAVQNNLIEVVTQGNLLLNFFLMVIVAPIMEELIFRKVLVDRALRYGQGMAIALSGLMFGLFHGNLNQFAYAVVLGGFFAFLYIKTGNIKITIGLHAIVNFLGSVVASQLMKAIHYDELMQIDLENTDAVLEMVMNHLGGWLLFALYGCFLLLAVLAGVIMVIISVVTKKFALQSGEIVIPKGQRFSTLLLNPGMLVFCIVWIIMIIMQLFQ